VHTGAFERSRTGLVVKLISNFPEQLRREVLRETGLHLSGPAFLGAFADLLVERFSVVRDHESGVLFRSSIKDTFHKDAGPWPGRGRSRYSFPRRGSS
jgi:hypothetical protein